jgi:hypothetical protein
MATVQDIRNTLRAYPEVEEAASNTSFRSATFKLDGRGFVAVEKDGVHATFALSEDDVRAQLTQTAYAVESIAKGEKLIGVRVAIAELTPPQLRDLIDLAWSSRRG